MTANLLLKRRSRYQRVFKVPNKSMLERCLGPSSHLQVLFSPAKQSFFLCFFALVNAR